MERASVDGEGRLQVHVKGTVSEVGEVDESGPRINRLQGDSEVDRNGGGAGTAFGVHDGEDLTARRLASGLATGGGETDEGFQQIGSVGRTLEILANTCTHGAHDELRLSHGADGEDGRLGKFLMKHFESAQRSGDGVDSKIDDEHFRREGLRPADDRIGGGERQRSVGARQFERRRFHPPGLARRRVDHCRWRKWLRTSPA